MQIGTRLCPTGANFLTRIMIRPTPAFLCAAAGVHWHHRMATDHPPVIADFVGLTAVQVKALGSETPGMGVSTNVPWRRFVAMAKEAWKRSQALGRRKLRQRCLLPASATQWRLTSPCG